MADDDEDDEEIEHYPFRKPADSVDEGPDEVDRTDEAKSADFVRCPRCRKYVHEEAVQCPYCKGYILEAAWYRGKPRWFVLTVFVALILIVLFWVLSGGGGRG